MELMYNNASTANDIVDIIQCINLEMKEYDEEYIPLNSTVKKIADILGDKKKVGRSFSSQKDIIKDGIEKSKNPQLAIYNLNFLLNIDNNSLSEEEISNILSITENVNNCSNSATEYYKKRYGYCGGKLTEEVYNKIQVGIKADLILKIQLESMLKEFEK